MSLWSRRWPLLRWACGSTSRWHSRPHRLLCWTFEQGGIVRNWTLQGQAIHGCSRFLPWVVMVSSQELLLGAPEVNECSTLHVLPVEVHLLTSVLAGAGALPLAWALGNVYPLHYAKLSL